MFCFCILWFWLWKWLVHIHFAYSICCVSKEIYDMKAIMDFVIYVTFIIYIPFCLFTIHTQELNEREQQLKKIKRWKVATKTHTYKLKKKIFKSSEKEEVLDTYECTQLVICINLNTIVWLYHMGFSFHFISFTISCFCFFFVIFFSSTSLLVFLLSLLWNRYILFDFYCKAIPFNWNIVCNWKTLGHEYE